MKQSAIIVLAVALATANAYALPCLAGCGGDSHTNVKSGQSGSTGKTKGGKGGSNQTGRGGDVKKQDKIGGQKIKTTQTNTQKTGDTTSNSGLSMNNVGNGNVQGGAVTLGSVNMAQAPNILPQGPTMKTGPNGQVEVTGGSYIAGPPQPAPQINLNTSARGPSFDGITNSGNGGATGGSNDNKNVNKNKGSKTGGVGAGGSSGAANGANGGGARAQTGSTGNGPTKGGNGGDGKLDLEFSPTLSAAPVRRDLDAEMLMRRRVLLRRQIENSRREAEAEADAEPEWAEYLDDLYARDLTLRYMMMTS